MEETGRERASERARAGERKSDMNKRGEGGAGRTNVWSERKRRLGYRKRRERERERDSRLRSFPPDLSRFQKSVWCIRNAHIYICVDRVVLFVRRTFLRTLGHTDFCRRLRGYRDETASSRDYDNFLHVARRAAIESYERRFRFCESHKLLLRVESSSRLRQRPKRNWLEIDRNFREYRIFALYTLVDEN